jgi:hypothetical protein
MVDRQAFALLLQVLEAPQPVISAHVIQDVHPEPGQALIGAGLLIPDGHEASSATEDFLDSPVTVLTCGDGNRFGHFTSTEGWVEIDPARLLRYRVNLAAFVRAVLPEEAVLVPKSPLTLIEGIVWELGTITFGQARSEIWFARRLHHSAAWSAVSRLARLRPGANRILLTSTRADRHMHESLPGMVHISIEDVVDLSDGPRINKAALGTRMMQGWADMSGPLQLSPDGSKLTIARTVTIEFRSRTHIAIIKRLVAGFTRGERFRARDLLDGTDSGASTLRNAFGRKKWKLLEPYLISRNGMWGFEF